MTTKELAKLIKQSFTNQQIHKSKTHPATKTFQALRILVNKETQAIISRSYNNINKEKNAMYHCELDLIIKSCKKP